MISYYDFAQTILSGQTLSDKSLDEAILWDGHRPFTLPGNPGRTGRISFSDEQVKFPKVKSLKEAEKKAMALNSFANHELLAIEMMAAAILMYPHESEEDIRFKKGILTALKDEQKHLGLYIGRMNELGYEFGDFPLNNFFWRQMEKLKTPAQYSAVMALTLEAANLDFAQYYARVFRDLGDEKTAGILDIVLEDEISHVAFGVHWMRKWKENKSLWEYFNECLPWPMTPARAKGIGFDPAIHMRAMNDEDFVERLGNFNDDFMVTRRK